MVHGNVQISVNRKGKKSNSNAKTEGTVCTTVRNNKDIYIFFLFIQNKT